MILHGTVALWLSFANLTVECRVREVDMALSSVLLVVLPRSIIHHYVVEGHHTLAITFSLDPSALKLLARGVTIFVSVDHGPFSVAQSIFEIAHEVSGIKLRVLDMHLALTISYHIIFPYAFEFCFFLFSLLCVVHSSLAVLLSEEPVTHIPISI